MASSRLLERTLYLVRHRPVTVTYAILAERADVTVPWLERVIDGRIKNPGVIKVEALYNVLAQEPLFIEGN